MLLFLIGNTLRESPVFKKVAGGISLVTEMIRDKVEDLTFEEIMNQVSEKNGDKENEYLKIQIKIQSILEAGRLSKGEPWYHERLKVLKECTDIGISSIGKLKNLLLHLEKESL